ncbi:hypothetical protein DENSPDRAFT_887082, partial [Dentipellis sp. KUC8613]
PLHAVSTPYAPSTRPYALSPRPPPPPTALHAPSAALLLPSPLSLRRLPPSTRPPPYRRRMCPPPASAPPSPRPPHAARALYALHALSARRPCAHHSSKCPLRAVRALFVPSAASLRCTHPQIVYISC